MLSAKETWAWWSVRFAAVAKVAAAVGTLMAFLLGGLLYTGDMVDGLNSLAATINQVNTFLASGGGSSILAGLATANRIAPVNEALAGYALIVGLKVAAILVRWLRSFLPTMGG